jgi:hypothetical protein
MKALKSYMYTSQEIQLAHEIANALNDKISLSFYLRCTKKYSHRLLRDNLNKVLSISKEKIRTSRGALFNHLVTQLDRDDGEYLYDHSCD